MAPSFFQNKQVKIGLISALLLLGNLLNVASAANAENSSGYENESSSSQNNLTPTERAAYITLGTTLVMIPPTILLCAGCGAFCLAASLLSYTTDCFGCKKSRYEPL